MSRFTIYGLWLTIFMLTPYVLISCRTSSILNENKEQPSGRIEDVSSVAAAPNTIRRDTSPAPLKQLQRVESIGDCAPRYKLGGAGMCINNRPCRGFGVKDEAGKIFCTCFGDMGGCNEGQRCDDRKLSCVLENEPLFERGITP